MSNRDRPVWEGKEGNPTALHGCQIALDIRTLLRPAVVNVLEAQATMLAGPVVALGALQRVLCSCPCAAIPTSSRGAES